MQYFNYLREILFLQETHSTESKEVNGTLFFSHGLSNSRRVLIGFLGQCDVNVLNQMPDNKGNILILNLTIDVKNFVLINLYTPNTKTGFEVEVLNTLLTMTKTIDISENTNLRADDFNVFFKTNLESCRGNPSFKQQSVAKLIEIIDF